MLRAPGQDQVRAYPEARRAINVTSWRVLKTDGQHGGRIRSRLECDGGLVLQNARTLADNCELAGELAPSWADAPAPADEIVRR